MRTRVARVGSILLVVVALALVAFALWANTPLSPSGEALAALTSDAGVIVMEGPWITFLPGAVQSSTGLVLYPGGRVDPRAYAPPARALAERGFAVVIVPMPLNLAVLAPGRAEAVIAAYPDIETWAIGGHSLGGAMAANFVSRRQGMVDGLVLWAAYPASGDDLSARDDLVVLSVYATRDGLMTEEERIESVSRLPAEACWAAIEGGNHAQFGAYGAQRGDNPAELTAVAQWAQIVEATAAFLQGLGDSVSGTSFTCFEGES